jgi:hypothetical protein
MPKSIEELKRQRQEQLFEQLHIECQRLAEELDNLKDTMVKSEATKKAENGEGPSPAENGEGRGEESETGALEGGSEREIPNNGWHEETPE